MPDVPHNESLQIKFPDLLALIETHQENLKNNCGKCVHSDVCKHKLEYENAMKNIIHEAQADDFLIQVKIYCKKYLEVRQKNDL